MKSTFIQLQNEFLLKAIDQELLVVKNIVYNVPFPSLAWFSDVKFMNYKKDSLTLNAMYWSSFLSFRALSGTVWMISPA